MEEKDLEKVATGEAHARFAEYWFAFLGYVALLAVLHAVYLKTDHMLLLALEIFSYVLLFRWVEYRLARFITFNFPTADATKRSKVRLHHVTISIGAASTITPLVAIGVIYLVGQIVEIQ